MTVVLMESEKISMFEFYKIVYQPLVAVTLSESHRNWYSLKVLPKKYLFAKIHDSSGHRVWESAIFLSAPVTMTLDKGHSKFWRALPPSTIAPSFMTVVLMVSEKMSMFEFYKIVFHPVTVTSDESHRNWYRLKGLPKKCLFAKFHDSSGHRLWENAYVRFFFNIFHQQLWKWPWMEVI